MWHLFLDESGDLGFDFENTDCSKYLTLCLLAVSQPQSADAIRRAVRKTLKRKVNTGKRGRKCPKQELKGTDTSLQVKSYFYRLVAAERFGVYALTLNKQKVYEELCENSESKDRLYNFIAGKVISELPFEFAPPKAVYLTVDRSKGKRGIADFDQYVEKQLQGRLDPRAKLFINHRDSHVDLGLSAADLFCWGIFRKHERRDSDWYAVFEEKIVMDSRYL